MGKGNIVSLEDRVPKLKQQRRKKANRRLIFLLLLFFSLIACVSYIQSPLSKVKNIQVFGQNLYNKDQIISQSGLDRNQNIWKVDKSEIALQIKKLPEVKKVKVSVKLPNTVQIKIEEYKRMAFFAKETSFYPVLENGKILKEQKLNQLPYSAPILKEFKEGKPLEEMIVSLKALPPEVVNSISEIHHTPTKTDHYHITLFMNDGFEVSATLRTFSEKMKHYPSILSQLDQNIKGVIDLEVGSYFKAYEAKGEESLEDKGER
ncbi:cell division protein FtsQ/DivIB [Bacillus sp. CGMCC 1.16607]|uniref:cell division protein FtsQ/DivIB n=1 Tax=Bacillus sp. CGMCC 1.16607 TaxID=3351842 RepID=UPI0036317A4A